jgi:hypothetical protein
MLVSATVGRLRALRPAAAPNCSAENRSPQNPKLAEPAILLFSVIAKITMSSSTKFVVFSLILSTSVSLHFLSAVAEKSEQARAFPLRSRGGLSWRLRFVSRCRVKGEHRAPAECTVIQTNACSAALQSFFAPARTWSDEVCCDGSPLR